jgi:hypothetical protein
MPPGQFKAMRQQQRADNTIPGWKSLHRGIHHHENQHHVDRFMSQPKKKRNDFRELLVHHQKVNEELKDVYARTAALVKDNLTMEQRKEESWRAFERIGGVRPKEKVKYAAHLTAVSKEKKEDRSKADQERSTGGDVMDYGSGSATEKLRKKRVGDFVRRQVDRAKLLRRVGDPTNTLGGLGHFDSDTNMVTLRNSAARKVRRSVEADKRVSAVKSRRKGERSMWDANNFDVNRGGVLRDSSRDLSFGPRAGGRGGRGGRGGGGGGGGGGRGGGRGGGSFAGKRGGRGRG